MKQGELSGTFGRNLTGIPDLFYAQKSCIRAGVFKQGGVFVEGFSSTKLISSMLQANRFFSEISFHCLVSKFVGVIGFLRAGNS